MSTNGHQPASNPTTLDWRSMSQLELDAGLNNSAAVADSDQIVADWKRRSLLMRAQYPNQLDMRYGPRERNRLDLLQVSPDAPTLLFIHGGYWQFRAKEHFTFAAAGPAALGINTAFIGYTLAPEATLDEIVSEVHSAVDYLAEILARKTAKPCIVAAGWSAGGHLAVMALRHPMIEGALSISGVFDLEPVRHSYLNDKLKLDENAALRNSPLRAASQSPKPVTLVAGSTELALLRQQTALYAASRAQHGLPVTYEEIEGANHFTIMDQLASPQGRIARLLRRLIEDAFPAQQRG